MVVRLNQQINNHGLGAILSSQELSQQYCQDKNGNKLTYVEALEIAQKSDCNKQANLLITFTENYQCNEITSTFWVDLNMNPEKNGCNPACVVNILNKTAEINWRCTGYLPPK
jgi:hypothetical protein